jgi:hypothetical protein
MEFRIWVETRLDGCMLERELVSSVERPASGIGLEEIGLKLEEGKAVLRKVQARIVQTQVDVLSAAHRRCVRCGRNQRVKDLRTRIARTVFGTVRVSCRRYCRSKRGGLEAVRAPPLVGQSESEIRVAWSPDNKWIATSDSVSNIWT